MYCEVFGLQRFPFEDRADPKFYYPTPDCEETLASMEYEMRYGDGLALVLGEAGTGKSMIVRRFVQRLRPGDHVVVITIPTAGHLNIVKELARGLGVSLPALPKTQRCLARLRKQLIREAGDETRSIVVIDQAENLSNDDLIELAAVSEFRNQDRRLLSIVLVGQPELMSLLNQPEFARLRQQAFTRRVLEPLSLEQTGAYIRHRLERAGAAHAEIFDRRAVELIHRHAAGNPRIINKVCNAALVAAYGAERTAVDRALIQEVIEPDIRTTRPAGIEETPGDRSDTATAPPHIASRGHAIGHREAPTEPGPFHPSSGGSQEAQERTCPFGATHAATPQQQAAAEQRLQTLCRKAESMLDNLSSSLQHAARSVESVERHAGAVATSCESRLDDLQERADRLARSAGESTERHAALEEAARRASEIESRLSRFAQDLADRMERAQEKTALMMTGLDTGEDVYNRLQEAAKEISSLTDDCKAEIVRHRQGLQEQIDEVQRLQHGVREEGFEAYRSQLEEATEDWRRTQFTRIKQEIARHQADVERLAEASAGHQSRLESLEERSQIVGAGLTGIQQSAEPLEDLLKEKEKRVAALRQQADEVSGTVDKAVASVTAARERLDASIANANVAREGLAAETEQGEELLGRVKDVRGDIERLQNTATEHLVQVGSTSQRLSAARDEADRCQDCCGASVPGVKRRPGLPMR
jgi:general secretion pathway protein A